MNISLIVILSIVIAIVLGYKTGINTGLFAMVFAYLIGCFALDLKTAEVIKFWPISTFFVIFAVSLFYNFALINGTLEKLAMYLLYTCRKFPKLLPLVIYFAAVFIAGLGAGFFTVLAFLAPLTILLCSKTGMNKLVGAVSVNYGALAGANFMTSASGIVFRGLMDEAGFAEQSFNYATAIFLATFILPVFVISFLIIVTNKNSKEAVQQIDIAKPTGFDKKQKTNLYLIFAMIIVVLLFPILKMIMPGNTTISFINSKIDIGLVAIVFTVLALMMKIGDQKEAIAKVPWNTLIMICGVGMLIQVAIKAGTIDLLASWIGSNIPVILVPFALAVIAAGMSFFSSTLGVVCPALYPVIASISTAAGLSPMLLFTVTIVGAQSSAISPFSSGGSLILGSCTTEEERSKMFPDLLFKGVPVCLGAALIVTMILFFIL